mmetsp:Transcript_33218/g.78780  ORF Transcript_33218/g.78780 Transcript_33218/m.78780 type:complete len:534 (-) Transcript_33218:142-1743(-)
MGSRSLKFTLPSISADASPCFRRQPLRRGHFQVINAHSRIFSPQKRACFRTRAVEAPGTTSGAEGKEEVEILTSVPSGEDPWEDPRWTKYKWTVYRGVAYDLTDFVSKHPAGQWLINLALYRDCTALFESYHLRSEVAVARLKQLPVLDGFPVDAVPRAPYPNDSDLYNTLRRRVREEVFRGEEVRGAHRSGTEWAAASVIGYTVAAYAAYAMCPNVLTGALLGLGGAWIGLTVQHCGNHGAMSTKPWLNNFYGLCNDAVGGSSLMWRYHHQVSHHVHCNDDVLDEDVWSALPMLRFDARQPRQWFHKYQHIYMWALFPFMQAVFQLGDITSLFSNRTKGATLYGATNVERLTVVLGKALHWGLVYVVPAVNFGLGAAVVAGFSYQVAMSIVLAATFAVSHNLEENKPTTCELATTSLLEDYRSRDWGVQQVITSSNWGGRFGNFMTGGLNLQIEHHLFPAVSFLHYPAISAIVRDECQKRGITYVEYPTLWEILGRFCRYMKRVGEAEQMDHARGGLSPEELRQARATLERI